MINFFLQHKNRIWLFIALLIAFALRAYKLDAQSLWNDEGTSIALASLSIDAIINGAARDIHPPLYYLLLHNWLVVSGNSEFAVRFFSVIAGVLTVAFTFRLARFFFDEEIALIAAFFAAFAPFAIYYSQETRMYVWALLWAAMSVYALAQILNSKFAIQNYELRIWLLYLTATIAALYTHYFAVTIIVFENIIFAIWWLTAIRNSQFAIRRLAHWLIGQLIIGALFLPWVLFAGNQLAAWPSISEPFDLQTLLWRVVNVFSVGIKPDADSASAVAIAFAILFVIGLLPMRAARSGIVTFALWAIVPVGVMYVVSLARPAYNPKFLLLALPAFHILAARGLARIYPGLFLAQRRRFNPSPLRWIYFVIAVIAAVGFMPSLQNYYDNPRAARDDYRAVVQFIDAHARAGDALLIDAPGQIDVIRYYHRGQQQLFLLPRMRPPDPIATRADVDTLIAQAQRVFAIFYATEQSDPQNIIGARLAERAFQARDEWHGDIRLAIYGIAPNPRGRVESLDAQLGDEIALASLQLDHRAARAGDVLTLTLNWRAEQTPTARYKVFAQLLNAENQVVAQRDAEPMNNLKLTTQWRAGETIADNLGIFIEPGMPPGDYRVIVGMYRADTGARLHIGASDHLLLGTINVW
ncbi:MAG: glycosyltransferase family 39 protein [Chloroflexi bacterium]|nr:glycosyltransferase family 39 protein [Chloroflexota bacterium]